MLFVRASLPQSVLDAHRPMFDENERDVHCDRHAVPYPMGQDLLANYVQHMRATTRSRHDNGRAHDLSLVRV
jgi:hypothetical protein